MAMELALEVIEDIYEINRRQEYSHRHHKTELAVEQTHPTEEAESVSDSFESEGSLNAEEELNLRRKIEMMRSYDEDDSFYD